MMLPDKDLRTTIVSARWLHLGSFFLTGLVIFLLANLTGCDKKSPAPQADQKNLLIDNTTTPRWVYQNQPPAKAAVVFVHGIFGDTMGTWTHANGKTFFDILRADAKLAGAVDMFAFGYTSEMFKGGSLDVDEAGNKLNEYLKREKINDYPAVVFVAHSMGGLVTLRHLLARREQLAKVPVIVLFGTPQSGADVANLAKHIVKNDALQQMVPGNQDVYLRNLDNEWRSIPAKNRPVVRCGYEKKKTFGVMIVPWDTATRFCTDPAMAIAEDHLGIVKPAGPDSDAVVLLVNALNDFVVGKEIAAKLVTPDFIRENNQLVFKLRSAFAKDNARLINAGRQSLKFTVADVSDPGLLVLPADTPRDLPGNEESNLQFLLAFGATENEYTFVLRTEVPAEPPNEQKVTIKVANMGSVASEQTKLAEGLSRELKMFVSDPARKAAWNKPGIADVEVHDAVIEETRRIVAKENPALSKVGQWVISTELLNALNWPNLAQRALSNVEKESPDSLKAKNIRRLAQETAAQSGKDSLVKLATPDSGAGASPSPSTITTPARRSIENPVTRLSARASAISLAAEMESIPALKPLGLSLKGDVQLAQGDKFAAHATFSEAAKIVKTPSPSIKNRVLIAAPDAQIDSKALFKK